jgi:carboxylesterase type B
LFARSGNPSASNDRGVPSWPVYGLPKRATMVLNLAPRVLDAPRDGERMLWARESFNTWDFTP